VSAPAICWCEKSEVTGDTVEAIATFFQVFLGISLDRKALEEMKEDEETREGATKAQLEAAGCNDFSGPCQGLFIGSFIRPFEPGNPPDPSPIPRRWPTSR
jgi:hypothetical protein